MQKKIIEGFRLSPQQKHLWLLQQAALSPDRIGGDYDPVYQTQCTVEIEGHLNPEVLKAALEQIINRHEILRTTFHRLPRLTVPVQVIADVGTESFLDEHDLSGLSPQEQEARIETLFQEALKRSFDLEGGPLLHFSLLTLSPTKRLLHIGLPALCADAATMSNLVREISRSYATLRGVGDEERLRFARVQASDEPMQYADFAEWQNELLESDDAESGIEYWRKQISDFLPLKLPFENQPEDLPKFAPRSLLTTVQKDSVAEIEKFVEKYEASTAAFFQACWQILLWRLTGQSDFVTGYGWDGRTYEELEEALGLFAKYLPLRCHLDESFQFREVLRQVDESIGEALEWGEYFSWEQTVKSSEMVENHFFPVSFDYEAQPTKYSAGGVSFTLGRNNACLTLSACVDRFKVKLSSVEMDGHVVTAFHYDSNLFREADIERLAGQFHALLESVIENLQVSIGELNILSDVERQQLLFEFNNTKTDFPKDTCIHHLIEKQAERTPGNIAVLFEGQQLTYAELNRRANQLAHHLQHLGVGPDVLVGICVERSFEMVVGILGILKTGGAYVPLDPTYPKERLAFMLEDTQAPVLLTQQRLVSRLPEHAARVVCLDTGWEDMAGESEANPVSETTAENIAYVIYTSGSTGRPKGVLISHLNLVHSTSIRMDYYHDPVTRFLLLSSFAFDSSVAGIFWTLCQGGTLVLPQDGIERDTPQVAALIDQNGITHMLSLPSLYALLLAEANPQQLASLRTVIVAGEACPKDLVDLHHQKLKPGRPLFNEYGPTEGTVWSSVYEVEQPVEAITGTYVPIGRPIANTQLYILDAHLQPVPIGVPGELCIGGDGVAPGYLNRPRLTAERFISNPFSDAPNSRLYKTGDLARYLPDGVIEFLGRIDHQVKIRGYRIELEEIEAVLRGHPTVRETAIIAREDTPGDRRLVAYYVQNGSKKLTVSELRNFLLEKLPEYMVPSAFVELKALPLTPNGKVDRQALPAPDAARPELEEAYVEPQTELERLLANIWREILGIEKIGIYDHFFELGGNSIQAAIIINKLQTELGEYIHVATLFKEPKIADFAAYLNAHYPNAVKKFGMVERRGLACLAPTSGHKAPLRHESRKDMAASTLQPISRDEEQLLAKLDGLSDEEVRSLLEEVLSEEGGNE